MAITVTWDDDARLTLCLEFAGRWHWEDLTRAIQEADAHIAAQAPAPVDIILDLTASRSIPLDFGSMARQLASHSDEARPNEGRRVLVGASLPLRLAAQSLMATYSGHLARRSVLFAANRTEARELLRQGRPTA
jgi:hypothetical protein